jgi:hypothetical protein
MSDDANKGLKKLRMEYIHKLNNIIRDIESQDSPTLERCALDMIALIEAATDLSRAHSYLATSMPEKSVKGQGYSNAK